MESSYDRISELPDPILGHILSFMPIGPATRTSILSSRWREIYKSATNLDFTGEFARRQTPDQLVASVDRYLQLHRGKKIRSFRLSLHPAKQYQTHIEKWVEFAATRCVEELHLDFFQPDEDIAYEEVNDQKDLVNIRNCLSTTGSLTHLTLSFCNFPPCLDFSSVRRLKSLSLRRVNFDDGMLQRVLSDCLLLETLSLRECQCPNSIEITSPGTRLRQVVLVDCSDIYNLKISAPSVESFHLFGDIYLIEFSFQGAASLADAFICSIGRECSEPEHDYVKLLSDLAHVKILTVCTATLMRVTIWEDYYMTYEEYLPLQLGNLQELQLLMDFMDAEYLSYVYGFFRLCPSPFLEKLFIWLPEILEDPNRTTVKTEIAEGPESVSFEHLRAIKLSNFKGSQCEMELVMFLLGKATNLECLVLVAPPIPVCDEDHRILVMRSIPESRIVRKIDLEALYVQLSSLPKASPHVQIVLSEYLEDDGRLTPAHSSLYCDEDVRFIILK